MRFAMTIAAVLAASAPAWIDPIRFTPSSSFRIPNPRNDHAAAAKRAARRRRNKAKRG